MFLRVVTTPAIAALADRSGERANVLIAVCAIAFLISLFYSLPQTYALTLAASLAFSIFLAPQVPLADALALSGVRRFASNYASMRVWARFRSCSSIWLRIRHRSHGRRRRPDPADRRAGTDRRGNAFRAAPGPPTPAVAPVRGRPVEGRHAARPPVPCHGHRVWAGDRQPRLPLRVRLDLLAVSWHVRHAVGCALGALRGGGSHSVRRLAAAILQRVRDQAPRHRAVVATIRWLLFPLVWPSARGLAGFVASRSCMPSRSAHSARRSEADYRIVPEERTGAAQGLAYFASGLGMAAVTLVSGFLYETFGAGGSSRWPSSPRSGWRPCSPRGVCAHPLEPARGDAPRSLVAKARLAVARRSSSGPSRSTKSAPCATSTAGAIPRDGPDHAGDHHTEVERRAGPGVLGPL